MFFNSIPEIKPKEFAALLKSENDVTILDIRETWEIDQVHIPNEKILALPMSILGQKQLEALPKELTVNKEAQIIVLCHHGSRSASVTMWLIRNGWKNTKSLAGGIDAYASEVDPGIGFY